MAKGFTPRYLVKLIEAFVARFKGLLFLGVILGFLIFVFLSLIYPRLFGISTQRVGLTGRYTTQNLPGSILNLIGEGLTQVNEKGEVKSGLAKSWEAKDDDKTWVFHLDEAKTWQDGKPISSEAINYNFEDVEVEKPNKTTLIFKLEAPFSPFPSIVAKPVFKKGFLGTGEWQVTKLSLAGSYVESIRIQKDKKERKIIQFYPTEERTKLAFELGHVDRIEDIVNPAPLDTWETVKLEKTISQDRYVAVFFNTQDQTLSDKNLRQALSYAIDKEQFGQKRALGPICPVCWAYNPQVKPYDFDPDKAKKLISGLDQAVREDLTIKLVTTPTLLATAEKIATNWEGVGVKTTVLVTATLPTEYQAFLAIYDIPDDPDQYSTWHSTQVATNISKYKSPRIDKLLEEGRLELDQEKRREIYLDFQRFLLEDAPAAFLYHPISYTISRK